MFEQSVPMPKQSVAARILNFDEVAQGYTLEQAQVEARRCLQCPRPQCVEGCPVGIDIPAFILYLRDGDLERSLETLQAKNSLPAICGRVCPQEEQCQLLCVLGKKFQPVAIGRLERFVADHATTSPRTACTPRTGKTVAVVGSGPAGLTAAAELAKRGHDVTVFEALHALGGVLMYGIPEFRLPKQIVREEIAYIQRLGVTFETDMVIGKSLTIDELFTRGFDAVFIGTGAGLPRFLRIPGENLCGIYSANEFLIRVNLMKAYAFPVHDTPVKVGDNVAVIGAGNVAMDAARAALRLGARNVYVVYRRSRTEAPARREELENAEEEGIRFRFLSNPLRFLGGDTGWITGIECSRMRLGDEDETGRRRPIPIPNSEYVIDVDTAIVAIGQSPNPLIPRTTRGLETTRWGTIVVDARGRTSRRGVYAGGDIVSGAATVISAMGAGKRAAQSSHACLMGTPTTRREGEHDA
jgi:glutamate synthase (NADPH/NADH) small chain